jgi:hypothetical protein
MRELDTSNGFSAKAVHVVTTQNEKNEERTMRMPSAVYALLAMAVSSSAWACSCAPPPPPKQSLAKSAAVFAGKVTAVKRDGFQVRVTFEISKTWKGTKGKTVEVTTASSGAACGYAFKKGSSYLVYCYAPKVEGKKATMLSTNICSRTKTLASAKADLKDLGPGKKP